MLLNKLFLLAAMNFGSGESDWYTRKLEGWYYFQQHDQPEVDASYSPEEANAVLEEEKRRLQDSLSLALLVPTDENIAAYVVESKRQIDRSAQFADAWGKALSEAPQSPKKFPEHLATTHFLLFCFRGQDSISKQAAQTARDFSIKNGWELKALSLDGEGIEGLDTFELDRGIGKILDIRSTPSFYAVDPVENKILRIGTGTISTSELERNIILQFGGPNDE